MANDPMGSNIDVDVNNEWEDVPGEGDDVVNAMRDLLTNRHSLRTSVDGVCDTKPLA